MSITQKIEIDMDEIGELVKNKLGMKNIPDNITITDYEVPTEEEKDTIGRGEDKNIKISSLVKKSNILKTLKQGLKDAGVESKYPLNAKVICEDSLREVLKEMSKKESDIFESMINSKHFSKFALLYQKYQSNIQNRL